MKAIALRLGKQTLQQERRSPYVKNIPCSVTNLLGLNNSISLGRIPSSKKTTVRNHTLLGPGGFVLFQDLLNDFRSVSYVIVSGRDDLELD